MKNFSYPDIQEAVEKSISFREAIIKLTGYGEGRPYVNTKRAILLSGVDTSHFLGRHRSNRSNSGKGRPLEEYLVKDGPSIKGSYLMSKLLAAGLMTRKCKLCGITKWRGKDVPLCLDHINGDPFDNRIENLRILCPNCHAQTDTYAGRNAKRRRLASLPPRCTPIAEEVDAVASRAA